ncbi:hypothetical protein EJ110_NYTH48316 [Nymphaea thermarum]|nr:hypothetical protein EJ110_NYTH48316 [Nymphaea thermarum]
MEQMIVVKFLAGLSSDYSASKAQMLTCSDFPDLDEAFNRLNRLTITLPPSSNNSQPSAVASFGGGRGGLYSSRGRGRGRGPGGRGRLQCTYCGRLGHLEDMCWNKVGKPNSSTSSSVTSSSSSTPNTHHVSMAPKANPAAASVDATSLNLSPAEIDLVLEHRSNVTPSTSLASTAGDVNQAVDFSSSGYLFHHLLPFSLFPTPSPTTHDRVELTVFQQLTRVEESIHAMKSAYYTSAKQMWDFLKQTYSNDKNVSKILQVEEELLNLQHGDQSLAQYFTSLKSISERLKALRPPCRTCYKTHGEQSMVAKFLQGLSSEYAVAKAQMLTGAEIPDLAKA